MGYRLLSQQEAGGLPKNHGALGMDVERAQQITNSGLTFDLMRVKQFKAGSPAERAGLARGDSVIAADGRVFPSIAAFAAYVGSISPGQTITIDYIPSGGGPAQAQRVGVTVGTAGQAAPQGQTSPDLAPDGMSTGAKIAIGVGAAALLKCYKMGCFSRGAGAGTPSPGQNPAYPQR